jgi:hypothetical protein
MDVKIHNLQNLCQQRGGRVGEFSLPKKEEQQISSHSLFINM